MIKFGLDWVDVIVFVVVDVVGGGVDVSFSFSSDGVAEEERVICCLGVTDLIAVGLYFAGVQCV